MTPAEAAKVIANVCAQWTGTIADGDAIKDAYRTLIAAAGVDVSALTAVAEVPADEPPKPPTPNRSARRKAGPSKPRRTPPHK